MSSLAFLSRFCNPRIWSVLSVHSGNSLPVPMRLRDVALAPALSA